MGFPLPSYSEAKKFVQWIYHIYKKAAISNSDKMQNNIRENQNLYKFLDYLYGPIFNSNILTYKDRIFPVALFPAPKEQ